MTLQNLSELITSRLKENNISIIRDLQNTIQLEIDKAILKFKEDIKQKTSTLCKQTETLNNEIQIINAEIDNLKKENTLL